MLAILIVIETGSVFTQDMVAIREILHFVGTNN